MDEIDALAVYLPLTLSFDLSWNEKTVGSSCGANLFIENKI